MNYSLKIKEIQKLYLDGKLSEEIDEKYADGYWDLAGEIVADLSADGIIKYHYIDDQLQTGIYQVFQKVLVRREQYE